MLEILSTINLTPIIQALIFLLAALITGRLIPWIKARTTNEQQSIMRAAVKTFVYAAEQLYGNGNGPKKLQYVENQLKLHGFEISIPEIEAAVAQAFNMIPTVKEETLVTIEGPDEKETVRASAE